jgi:hypothetical protein
MQQKTLPTTEREEPRMELLPLPSALCPLPSALHPPPSTTMVPTGGMHVKEQGRSESFEKGP